MAKAGIRCGSIAFYGYLPDTFPIAYRSASIRRSAN